MSIIFLCFVVEKHAQDDNDRPESAQRGDGVVEQYNRQPNQESSLCSIGNAGKNGNVSVAMIHSPKAFASALPVGNGTNIVHQNIRRNALEMEKYSICNKCNKKRWVFCLVYPRWINKEECCGNLNYHRRYTSIKLKFCRSRIWLTISCNIHQTL